MINVKLLEAVRRAIIFRPERFCAAQWAFARNGRAVKERGAPPVGFRCCIAGHVLLEGAGFDERTLLARGGFHDGEHLWHRAGAVLGLTKAQRDELFFPSQWAAPYKQEYYCCAREQEAKIAAAYIDYFVSKYTGAAEKSVTGCGRCSPAHEPVTASSSHAVRSSGRQHTEPEPRT